MKLILFLGAVPLILCITLRAADSDLLGKPPLPGGLLPARAPDFASWEISYATAKAGAGASSPPAANQRRESVTKTGTTYHREEVTGTGQEIEQWWMNGFQLTGKEGGPYSFSDGNDGSIDQIDYQISDFPELDWIGPDCYVGITSVSGVPCFLFRKQISLESRAMLLRMPAGQGEPRVEASAWLDAKSGLPVQTSVGDWRATYRFLPPPSSSLNFPADGLAHIRALQAQTAALQRPRVAP
jgi:hypothetical protein